MSEKDDLTWKALVEKLADCAGRKGGLPRDLHVKILRDMNALRPHDYFFPAAGLNFINLDRTIPHLEGDIRKIWEQSLKDFEEGRPLDNEMQKLRKLFAKETKEVRKSKES